MNDSKVLVSENGAVGFVGRGAVDIYRLMVLRSALALEIKGLKLSRGPSASSRVKGEFGFKGNKAKLLTQLDALIDQRKQEVPVEREG